MFHLELRAYKARVAEQVIWMHYDAEDESRASYVKELGAQFLGALTHIT